MARQCPATVTDGRLRLQGIQEGGSEAVNVVHAPHVLVRAILSHEIAVAFCDPVPEQAEDEPAPSERGHKQEEDKAPSDLHKGGPEI